MNEDRIHLDDLDDWESITLETYDKLNVTDRCRLSAERPEVFSRLMDDRRAEQEAAARTHHEKIEAWSRTPLNRTMKRKPQPQRPQEQRDQEKQPKLEAMSETEIQGLTAEIFDKLTYTDRLRLFDERPSLYARLRVESMEKADRLRRGW